MAEDYDSIAGSVLASIIQKYSSVSDESFFVVLTPELADHLANMYANTKWDDLEDFNSIYLPEDIFSGDLDRNKLDSHVGEHIRIALAGEPIEDIFSLDSFPPYFTLRYESELLENFTDECMDFFGGTYESGYIILDSMMDYIRLALKNGKNEKQILKEVNKRID